MRQFLQYAILLPAGALCWAAAVAARDIPADLDVYGEVYPNACKPTERKARQASLAALKEPDMQKLSQAIDTLLCAPGTPANERDVRQMLASRVKTTDEATGSDAEVRRRRPSPELAREVMAKGDAWGATVEPHEDGIVVHYWANEACVASVVFSYRGRKWWISRAGSACD